MFNIVKQKLVVVLLFLIVFPVIQVSAQEQNLCTQTLKKALKTYDEGRLDLVPSMLQSCMQNGFIKAEKLQAYRLLILTYLFQDEDQKAEEILLDLFKLDPEYKVNEAIDPAEFINLYNTFRTLPVISIGFIGGMNQSMISLKREFSTENTNSTDVSYKRGTGYQFGAIADILLYKKLQLTTAFLFSGKKYEMTSGYMFGYTKLKVIESQQWLELPVTLKYNLGSKKFIPYVQAGISGNLFLNSFANLSRISVSNDNDASGPSVSMSNLRRKVNYSAVFGTGARYKIGYGYILLDIRYSLGLGNMVKVANRYSNNELIYYYGHIDSDYTLNNLFVSFGYLKSIYKPKKIRTKND